MKTSNKLLALLVSAIFILTLANNFLLSAEYKKIDVNNPFYDYKTSSLSPFKHIVLTGGGYEHTEIRQGSNFGIKTKGSPEVITWKIRNDTLTITYGITMNENQPKSGDTFRHAPITIITAPAIVGITSTGISCKVADWKIQRMNVSCKKGAIFFVNDSINKASISLSNGSIMQFDSANHVGSASFELGDSSKLIAINTFSDSINLKSSRTAYLDLPADLLSKIKKREIK